MPRASIVVATHNRADRVARLLAALEAQHDTVPFEVIVVDDGSTDGTEAMLRKAEQRSDLDLTVLRLETNKGPATARNAGWRAARADVVCFTDDDCVPHPGWVSALLTGAQSAEIVQGRTVPAPSEWEHRGPFSHTMTVPAEDGLYSTCNIAYRRELLERVGGFDEAFSMAYGEDTDLAWRAIDAGATTHFAPDAVVEHEVRPSSFREHLRGLDRREGMVHAIHKHPGLRELLPYRGYVHPPHLRVLALAASAVLLLARPSSGLRWSLGAATLAWYAQACRRWRMAPPDRWRWLPALPLAVVADLVELSVLLRASVRYRELML